VQKNPTNKPEPLAQSLILNDPVFEPRPTQFESFGLLEYQLIPEPELFIGPPSPIELSDKELPIEPKPKLELTMPLKQEDDKMAVDHEGKSYLKKRKPFSGDRCKVDSFIYECNLFFEGSSPKDFPVNKQKIIFILSYMSKGEALQ